LDSRDPSPGEQPPKRVIVPLDFDNAAQALAMATRLDPRLCRVKVGKELFTAAGPEVVQDLHDRGFEVFLDLKFHDIPNTVAGACRAAAKLGVWMVDVHASGGEAMLRAAREALDSAAHRPLLVAVTILTSLADADLERVGFAGGVERNVERLARLAQSCGLDGAVCSAQEAAMLRRVLQPQFRLVTPGIRLAGAAADDQSRIVTPADAVRLGADYLVIGRPITQSPDPAATLASIRKSLEEGTPA
jgi:orotidine-5'-phosphate decarboxylase